MPQPQPHTPIQTHTHQQTTKFTLCGCIISLKPVPCNQDDSCPSLNKMKITEEDSFCLHCFKDAEVRYRWYCRVRKWDPEPVLTFVEVEEEEGKKDKGKKTKKEKEKEEEDEEGKKKRKKKKKQKEGEESQDEDDSEDTEEEEEDKPDKKKDKSKTPRPDYGVDVSRHCYPVAITSAYVQQRKKERVEAELKRLMALYGDTYWDGEFEL